MADPLEWQNGSVKHLRLWPGLLIVGSVWGLRIILPLISAEWRAAAIIGGVIGGLFYVVWWLFFSKATWLERIGALVVAIGSMYVVGQFVDQSISTAMMGLMLVFYSVPVFCLAHIIWAVSTQNFNTGTRRITMVGTILVAASPWLFVRTGGFNSELDHDFAWRWSETREERLLAKNPEDLLMSKQWLDNLDTDIEWPGFRGANRDGIISGLQVETNWTQHPLTEMWRRDVGPGWSSFSVDGPFFYTQEQRGDWEVVSCYRVSTGEVVWQHENKARFWESNAGAGPRATPTLDEGRLFTFGATGILNALNATDGSVIWSRDVSKDTDVSVPGWAFASSPLIVGNKVVVAAAGTLAAYKTESGVLAWKGPDGKDGYSSPHLMKIDGAVQVVHLSKAGAVGVDPADGSLLWTYDRPGGSRIVQPAMTPDGDLLVSRGEKSGLERIAVKRKDDEWTVEGIWTTNRLKPYFSDFVVHGDYAFGIDGSRLVCIRISDGERMARGKRYGSGQLVLLAEQDLLVVLAENGELVLVNANPEELVELARVPVLEGKTWNHPVVVGEVLLVRNAHHMAAYRVPTRKG